MLPSSTRARTEVQILVTASTNSQWNLVTGDAFVYDLGALADGSSGTNAPIGAEGMIFFKTTAPADALAWRLWLNGATNILRVKSQPHPVSYELAQLRQMYYPPPISPLFQRLLFRLSPASPEPH